MSGKRTFLTLLKKYKIIQEVDEKKSRRSEIARQHGIPSSTLCQILKMREEIVNAVQKEGHNLLAKSLRGAMHVDLEQALFEWYSQQKANNIPINGLMIQKKANEFATRLGIENFKCSNGWVYRFKTRRGISGIKVNGESPSVNRRSKREWLIFLQSVLGHYQPQDVYSADELGMFHNLMPDRKLLVKGFKYKDVKRRKERHLTVLLCCNMDGSDKLNPLVIGKFKKPRDVEDNILPCDYDFNEEVGMTSAVFMRWLARFDAKMAAADRKVVLFVNSCLVHVASDSLRNVELVFMAENGVGVLRPLDQGVLQQVKMKLREMFVRSVVCELDVGKQVKKWDVLRAMEGIVTSWKAVKPATIVSCFRDARFVPPVGEPTVAGAKHFAPTLDEEAAILVLPTTADTEYGDDPLRLDTKPRLGPSTEPQAGPSTAPSSITPTVVQPCDEKMWQKLSADFTYAEFMILDDDVEGQQECSVEEVEVEMEEDPRDIPTMRDVLKAGDIFARMLKHLDASEEMWSQFNSVKDFVKQTCSKKQTLITDFFKK